MKTHLGANFYVDMDLELKKRDNTFQVLSLPEAKENPKPISNGEAVGDKNKKQNNKKLNKK